MFTSFSTALSALSAHTTAIDVVGNNLANLNTPTFKASVVAFYDLVTQSLGAGLGETQVGFGVARPNTLRQFSQGAIRASSGDLDVAIQGDGFIVLRDPQTNAITYSRGGNLQVDRAGNLLTSTGQRVQGWMQTGNAVLSTNGPVNDIVVPVGSLRPPVATTEFSIDLNLDANATIGPPPDTFSTAIEVFDSLGSSHVVTVAFTKSATANEWGYSMTFPDSDVSAPIAPVTGTVTFGPDGRLTSPAVTAAAPTLQVTGLSNGAENLSIAWSLFSGQTPRLTQYAQPSSISANQQNGNATAQLIRVGVGTGGVVLAQYSNGVQEVVGRLGMASIRNPESLLAVGSNSYALSARTALPAIGIANTGGRGQIVGAAVENSTTDIAREFTNLIVLQRGYQANARVVTTVDEISQETINLKR